MSHRAIAAALALVDVSGGERLAAFSLASFANRAEQAWPGTRVAAARAGLSRSQYLEARDRLARRELISIEAGGGGRANSTLVTLTFAEAGERVNATVNAELFELVLGYSRSRGPARLLLAALAAVADTAGIVAEVTTDELRGFASLPDRSYRRARAQLLADGEARLEDAGGGRAKTNRWRIRDPRLIEQTLSATDDRPSRATGPRTFDARAQYHRRPASIATGAAAETRPPGEGSGLNPGPSRTALRGNPGQIRTGSAKTPAKTGPLAANPGRNPGKNPGAQHAHGKGTSEPRNRTPHPPGGGAHAGHD
jgi:hypothetical protein